MIDAVDEPLIVNAETVNTPCIGSERLTVYLISLTYVGSGVPVFCSIDIPGGVTSIYIVNGVAAILTLLEGSVLFAVYDPVHSTSVGIVIDQYHVEETSPVDKRTLPESNILVTVPASPVPVTMGVRVFARSNDDWFIIVGAGGGVVSTIVIV